MNTDNTGSFLLYNHIHRMGMGCTALLVFGFFLGIITIAIVFGAWTDQAAGREVLAENYLPALAAGFLLPGTFMVVFWLATSVNSWRENRAVNKLMNGEIWAAWTYDAGEWQVIVQRQHEFELDMITPRSRVGYVLPVIVVVFWGGMALVIEEIPDQIRLLYLAIGAFMAAVIVGSSVVGGMRQRNAVRRSYEHRQSTLQPTVTIGPSGFYHDTEGYVSLKNLSDVRLDASDIPLLVFTVLVRVPRASTVPMPVPIAIPKERAPEAKDIVNRFRQQLK